MNCETCLENLSAWLDGELDPETGRGLAAHLEACPACRDERVAFRAGDLWLRSLPALAADPGMAERLEARLSGPSLKRPSRLRRLVNDFIDTLRSAPSAPPDTLDVFSDFPPYGPGRCFMRLIDSAGQEA